ncbi:MAG: MerR family transcriptional regulator [Firmicutes bacterium]|nr:MerR family transcriptional regulator [Bacillota bacterium]
MYTIGQFSKICQVTTKALRHYEKLGLITPAKVEKLNQYRYYTKDQLPTLKKILFLKELGIPLKHIKQIISQHNDSQVIMRLIDEHRKHLLMELDLCNSRLTKLAWWKKSMEAIDVTTEKKYDIRIRDVQEIPVYGVRKKMSEFPKELPNLIRSLLDEIVAKGGVHAGAPIMMYYDEEFNSEIVDVEVAWPVMDTSIANKTLQPVRAVSTIHVGPYEGLCNAYEAIFNWINENKYKAVIPTREISLNDPQTTSPDQLVTEILVPVEDL